MRAAYLRAPRWRRSVPSGSPRSRCSSSPAPKVSSRPRTDAALVVVGLTDRWQREGLGPVREALVTSARPPVLLARGGLRPGGLAPTESLTRFTWSIRP